MKGDKLGAAFFAYLVEKKPTEMKAGEPHALLYGDDEFVMDRERGVLSIPDVGEVGFQLDSPDEEPPQWLAVIANGDDLSVVVGNVEPFSDEAKSLLPHSGGHIRAMPIWIKRRAQSPQIRKMLEKQGLRAPQGRGSITQLFGRRAGR